MITAELELRHIRYFIAVAEQMNFGRAAKYLHISQPPLSRQIHALERHIGASLFDRSGKGLRLTEAGRVFLEESRLTIDQISGAVTRAQRASRGEIGSLTIGYVRESFYQVLPYLQNEFAMLHSGIKLNFQYVSCGDQIPLIRDRALDAGVIASPVWELDQLTTEPIFRERAMAVVATGHPLAKRQIVSLAELRGNSIAYFTDGFAPPQCGHIPRMSNLCGVPLHVGRNVHSEEELFQLTRSGEWITILPASSRRGCLAAGLAVLRIKDRNADFTFGLAYRRSGQSQQFKFLLELARKMQSNALDRRAENSVRPEDAQAAIALRYRNVQAAV